MISPLYDLYPKDPAENLEWRIRCRERALTDLKFRAVLQQACETDILFFFAFALWVHEPRAKVRARPFIPWPHQESVLLAMDAAITEAQEFQQPVALTLKKSRAQGATFSYLGVQIYRALKDPGFSSGLVSRNEKMIDSKNDASTVMFKLAAMLDKLPFWMLDGYERNLGEHTISLPNGSAWVGYAATGDVARGGRTTMFALDEIGSEEFIAGGADFKVMSSVAHVTHCVFLCSTFGADAGVFYEAATDVDNKRLHTLDWKDNPEHNRLLYVKKDGLVKAVRPEEQAAVEKYIASSKRELRAIERSGHLIENKVRSPWYDAHCRLPGATPRFIARELDMDPRGAVGKVFTTELLDLVKKEHCRPPTWQGTPVFDGEDLELKGLLPRSDGALKLWFKPGADWSPPLGPFTVGCDMASGSDGVYSSNSVASILDDRTGEQVGEYAVKGMPLIKFARVVVGLCFWLRKARLGWEDSGMAGPFAKEILETIYYGNVYYREVPEIGSKRKSRKAGWGNRKNEDKADLFEKMALGMETGKLILRSEDLVREAGEYEWKDGKIVHAPTENHGAKETNHGDRCLIAGTMVTTNKGEVPIESISVGDLVVTRDGLRPVQCCGETGISEVFRLTLSNGRTLTGTGNHPVWTENRSWVQLQSLRESDILLACPQQQFAVESTSENLPPRRSSSTAGRTIGTRLPSRGPEGSTSGAGASTVMAQRSRSMSLSGSITTDQSQPAISYTTRTITRSTTTPRTLSASRLPSMEKFTRTANILRRIAERFCMPTSVSTAAGNTGHSGSTARSSAVPSAERNTARNCVSASPAEASTEPNRRAPRRTVQSSAQFVCVTKREKLARSKVYNLSVAGTPEYFAQGILVHNCIAAGVAWLVYTSENDGKIDKSEQTSETPEYGSWLWRERQERSQVEEGSPEFGIRDVVNF